MKTLRNSIFTKQLSTPVGKMLAAGTAQGLCAFEFMSKERISMWEARQKRWYTNYEVISGSNQHIASAEKWLNLYFQKRWTHLPEIPLDARGSDFELAVWHAILTVKPMQTVTYKALADFIGRPKAARAVGKAVSCNPLALIIPCHRIVGASGSLVGYSGSIANKMFLLAHEQPQIHTHKRNDN